MKTTLLTTILCSMVFFCTLQSCGENPNSEGHADPEKIEQQHSKHEDNIQHIEDEISDVEINGLKEEMLEKDNINIDKIDPSEFQQTKTQSQETSSAQTESRINQESILYMDHKNNFVEYPDWATEVPPKDANCFVYDYHKYSDAVLLGLFEKDIYTMDTSLPAPYVNEDRSLESWFINIEAIKKCIKDSAEKKVSGIRVYPAMNKAKVKVENNGVIQEVEYLYHTLVFYPTYFEKWGPNPEDTAHINIIRPFEYVDPCPNFCNSKAADTVGKTCK